MKNQLQSNMDIPTGDELKQMAIMVTEARKASALMRVETLDQEGIDMINNISDTLMESVLDILLDIRRLIDNGTLIEKS